MQVMKPKNSALDDDSRNPVFIEEVENSESNCCTPLYISYSEVMKRTFFKLFHEFI